MAKENNLEDKSLELLMGDAVKFARSFAADIAEHPLYVYYTALPLYPQNSILYQTFHDSRVDPSMSAVSMPDEDSDIAYTSDGQRYAVATGRERRDIAIRATATGQEHLKIANDKDFPHVTCVTFSDDGCRIAAGAANSAIYFWDSDSGSQVAEPLAHSTWAGGVCAVAWSADGERLLSASDKGEMMLWNTAPIKGSRLSTMLHPDQCSGYINALAFSSDGSQIASCSYKGHIFVWDPIGGIVVWSAQIHQGLGTRVSFSPNHMGEFLLVRMDEGPGMEARDPSTGNLIFLPDGLAGAIGLSRGGFMINLLYQRIEKNQRWEDDRSLQWGAHGEYFMCRRSGQTYIVYLPKGVR